MKTKKLTFSTLLILFLLFAPPVLGQSKQQNNSNNNNWISQIQSAVIGALAVFAIQIVTGRMGKGGKFEIQEDISKSTAPITSRIDQIDDKLIVIDTNLKEQEKENARIKSFVKTEVGNLGDRLENKIQQTDRDLEAERRKNEANQVKLEEAIKEATKEIREMSVNIARMTETFKHFNPNQK